MQDTIRYEYHFRFPDGREENFNIELDGATLEPKEGVSPVLPEWTRLEFRQCQGCPRTQADGAYCPLAVNISPVVEQMSDIVSFDKVEVNVTQDDRTVTRHAMAQEGLSSLIGLLIATSGCPFTAFFKPMARFHLPFANIEETLYRAASMYMLGQYYRWKSNLSADLDMNGLQQYYAGVATVNKGMAGRIRSIKRHDGAVNAIVLLDMFVHSAPHEVEKLLNELNPLFAPYLVQKHFF
jgi:hypothetical protein